MFEKIFWEGDRMKERRKEVILAAVQEETKAALSAPEGCARWSHAAALAERLRMDRANVARELNLLYQDGQLIKVQGKPTYYISRFHLEQHYPSAFFPSTLPKGSEIQSFLSVAPERPPEEEMAEETPVLLENQIGAQHTLRTAILHAKAAVMYPSHDMHTLIYGNVGVGRGDFAHRMFLHAVATGSMAKDAPYIIVNCRDYEASPQGFLNQLFGYSKDVSQKGGKSRRGLIERAAGGVLCLNGVEKLPPSVQRSLTRLIDKKTFTRIGEASVTRYANVMIVAISTDPPQASSISLLQQHFPVLIHIPNLIQWDLHELAELIITNFRKESESTGLCFRLQADALAAFLKADYPDNLGSLYRATRTTCSLVYLRHSSAMPHSRIIEITLSSIHADFLAGIHPDPEADRKIAALLSELELEYITFTPKGISTNRYNEGMLMERLHHYDAVPTASAPPAQEGVTILALFHGESVAEQLADYANAAVGRERVIGLSYHAGSSLVSLRERVMQALQHRDTSAGVLIAADMNPLTELGEFLFHNTGIPNATIGNAGLPVLMALADASLRPEMTLHLLTEEGMTLVSTGTAEQSSSFLDGTIKKMLIPTLTFLNPQKACSILNSALTGLLNDFGIVPTNDIVVKFTFHCAHMLERLIRGESLKYDGLKAFINANSTLFTRLEMHMQYVAELFGVSIPASELAYIAEILLPYFDIRAEHEAGRIL